MAKLRSSSIWNESHSQCVERFQDKEGGKNMGGQEYLLPFLPKIFLPLSSPLVPFCCRSNVLTPHARLQISSNPCQGVVHVRAHRAFAATDYLGDLGEKQPIPIPQYHHHSLRGRKLRNGRGHKVCRFRSNRRLDRRRIRRCWGCNGQFLRRQHIHRSHAMECLTATVRRDGKKPRTESPRKPVRSPFDPDRHEHVLEQF